MAVDPATAEQVRQVLKGRQDLVERRMMGGLCFMLSGNMCCGVRGSSVMVRVGRDAYAGALTEPGVRPLEFAGRRPNGFVVVGPDGWSASAGLAAWVQRGVDFVTTLPEKGIRLG